MTFLCTALGGTETEACTATCADTSWEFPQHSKESARICIKTPAMLRVDMCICMYICIYIYIYMYKYVCMYIHTHTHRSLRSSGDLKSTSGSFQGAPNCRELSLKTSEELPRAATLLMPSRHCMYQTCITGSFRLTLLTLRVPFHETTSR